MSRPHRIYCAAACLLCLPAIAIAQTTATEETEALANAALAQAAAAQNEAGGALMSRGSPADRAMGGFSYRKPVIDFSTEQGETEVSLAFSFDLESHKPERRPPDESGTVFYKVSRSKLAVVASAPIDDRSKPSALFSGDSLIHGTRLKLSFTHLSNKLGNGAGALNFLPPAYQACILDQANAWLRKEGNSGHEVQVGNFISAADREALAVADVDPADGKRKLRGGEYEIALETLAEGKTDTLESMVYLNCVPGSDRSHRYGDDAAMVAGNSRYGSEFASHFYDERSALKFWGFDASVGQDKYAYLDSASFEKPEVSKTSWEVGAYAGLINWNSTFSVRARAVYGRSWDLPEETETCETFGTPPEEHCLTGPDGPPQKHDTGLFSLEARHLVALNETTRIAIAPQITYRFEDDALGVEVPVYLSPDEQGKLTGGLKFAYTSKGDEFGVGVFVGVPFSIFFE